LNFLGACVTCIHLLGHNTLFSTCLQSVVSYLYCSFIDCHMAHTVTHCPGKCIQQRLCENNFSTGADGVWSSWFHCWCEIYIYYIQGNHLLEKLGNWKWSGKCRELRKSENISGRFSIFTSRWSCVSGSIGFSSF